MTTKLPDAVLPPQEMGVFFDPAAQVCGFTFMDGGGQVILLPIPGEMMSALVDDARRQLDSIDGAIHWLSVPGVAVEKAPAGH